MARLLETDELITYLDADEEDAAVIASIRDAVEDMLVTATDRDFGPAKEVVDEVHDGTGTRHIYTTYPIALLDSVVFKSGTEEFTELELNVGEDLIYTRGKRKITGRFTRFPKGYSNILISYETEDDRPELAKQAVREIVAQIFRSKGSEEARSEHVGSFEHVMKRSIDESLMWKKAVDLLHRPNLAIGF